MGLTVTADVDYVGYDCEIKNNYIESFTTTGAWACGEPFMDERDSREYATVQIGNPNCCWMAENLRYSDSGSGDFWCYNDHYSNCENYGVLYGWTTAVWVCPDGWHLPANNEWKYLEGTVDSQYPVGDHEWDKFDYRGFDAGKKLKSASGWTNNGNGTDLYGFGALPGGLCSDCYQPGGYHSFDGLGRYNGWWSSNNEGK
ncbi:MAG: hypothetical protein GY746_16150, partial [Gammaproteobacteria bacterium]|nr:hypothetical protein [Gammaproteobacteria bacterium]